MLREFFKDCSIKNCLNEIGHALGEIKGKRTKEANDLRSVLKEAESQAKEIVKKEYKEYMKGFELVECHSCHGKGSKSKYVGLGCGDSYSDSPYISVRCSSCNGEGVTRRKKYKEKQK